MVTDSQQLALPCSGCKCRLFPVFSHSPRSQQIPRILYLLPAYTDGALLAFGAHLRQSDASGVTRAGPPGPLDDHFAQSSRAGLRLDSFAGQCGGAVRRARLVGIRYEHMPPHRQRQKREADKAGRTLAPAQRCRRTTTETLCPMLGLKSEKGDVIEICCCQCHRTPLASFSFLPPLCRGALGSKRQVKTWPGVLGSLVSYM